MNESYAVEHEGDGLSMDTLNNYLVLYPVSVAPPLPSETDVGVDPTYPSKVILPSAPLAFSDPTHCHDVDVAGAPHRRVSNSTLGVLSPVDPHYIHPLDDLSGTLLEIDSQVSRQFFERHLARDPEVRHCVILPDNVRSSGEMPTQRFTIWVTHTFRMALVTALNPCLLWEHIHIQKVVTGPHGTLPKEEPASLRDWLGTPLRSTNEEALISDIVGKVYPQLIRRIEARPRISGMPHPGQLIRAELSRLALRQGVGTHPKRSSLREALKAHFRAAYVREREAELLSKGWASGFAVSTDLYLRDANLLRSLPLTQRMTGKPIEQLAIDIRASRLPRRLNPDRLTRIEALPCPPDLRTDKVWTISTIQGDWDRLLSFAREGVPIARAPGRTEVTGWKHRPPLRRKYLEGIQVVNKNLVESWIQPGLALLLPVTDVVGDTAIVGSHVSEALNISAIHHTPQPGKPGGRVLMDSSNHPTDPCFNLNGKDTRQECRKVFGILALPTIMSICFMIVQERTRVGETKVARLLIGKADLKGAFTLLDINPEHVPLNAYEMVVDHEGHLSSMLLILLAGYFGWTGFPFAFGVVSRVLTFLINRVIVGSSDMYVDDVILVTLAEDANGDLDELVGVVESVMGAGSIAANKFSLGRVVEVLGWIIDLESNTVRSSERNFLKGLYWLWVVGSKSTGITLLESEKVAAYATRLAFVCPIVTPFLGPLYRMQAFLRRGTSRHASGEPLHEFSRAISVCLVSLCLLHFNSEDSRVRITIDDLALSHSTGMESGDDFNNLDDDSDDELDAIPLRSRFPVDGHIITGTTDVVLQVDGCLTGAAFAIWKGYWLQTQGQELLGYGMISFETLFPQSRGLTRADGTLDSSYQNASELFAIVFGTIYLLNRHRPSPVRVHLVADSRTTLSWVSKRKWTGKDETVRMSVALMLMFMRKRVIFSEFTHVTSKDNRVADDLSRGIIPEGLDRSLLWEPHLDSNVLALLTILHPFAHRLQPDLNKHGIVDIIEQRIREAVPTWDAT